jgi:hypothetical protein
VLVDHPRQLRLLCLSPKQGGGWTPFEILMLPRTDLVVSTVTFILSCRFNLE